MIGVGEAHIVVGIALFGAIAVVITLLIWRRYRRKQRDDRDDIPTGVVVRTDSMNERLQSGIAKLHQQRSSRNDNHYYVVRRGVSGKPLFSWSDHPSLVTDAVENGWSRFAFAAFTSSPSSSSTPTSARFLGMCAVGDFRREPEPEMSWEICQDSVDFMQKIRLNPGSRKALFNNVNSSGSSSSNNHNNSATSVIRTGLPLPGPALGNKNYSSFPQEAYFEITVLYGDGDDGEAIPRKIGSDKVDECEKTKLIQENNSNARASSESMVHFGNANKAIEELKLGGKDDGKGPGTGVVVFSVGLTAGGSLPLKLPGSYPGSIGFNSDGSVYVDGIKLVFASEKAEWERRDRVIGCGFDPKQKRVFFTVDSEVIHVVHCKSEEFGTPLYPTMAANSDVLVVVNLGQSVFQYAPANSQRTQNPCFVGPTEDSPAATIGYDDSKELFSMGRIDSQWLNRYTTRGGQTPGNPNKALDFDEESEADLFEIVLDSCGRSPNVVS